MQSLFRNDLEIFVLKDSVVFAFTPCNRRRQSIIAVTREKSYMSLAVCWNIPEKINSFKSDRFLDHRNLLLSIHHLGLFFFFLTGHISNQIHIHAINNHTCMCIPCAHAHTHMHTQSPEVNTWLQFSYCPKLNLNIQ